MTHEIKISNTTVGSKHPMFIIAEVGLAHDGSLGAAHSYIEKLSTVGVNAVKFQTHLADAESSKYENFRVNVFPQDETRREYWKRTAFSKQQWKELAEHARELGLIFMSSPFSKEAVDILLECEIPAWKVASGEIQNLPLLKYMANTGLPILLSSGMSTWEELNTTTSMLGELGAEVAIFQCTTSYPCPPKEWGLNVISEMIEAYDCPIGLSDHSGTIFPSLAAKILGASMIECHVVFDRAQFGPDSKASLTFEGFEMLVNGIRALEIAERSPVDKDKFSQKSLVNKNLFSKGLFAAHDLVAGVVIGENDLNLHKPLMGIPASEYEIVIGGRLNQDLKAGEPFPLGSVNQD
ncbi:N-acetylneuraminate synthase family protein [bacterium]|nr:N-acetylneuraminate synthase family protein [bacterium]